MRYQSTSDWVTNVATFSLFPSLSLSLSLSFDPVCVSISQSTTTFDAFSWPHAKFECQTERGAKFIGPIEILYAIYRNGIETLRVTNSIYNYAGFNFNSRTI